jgi:DNA-binding CsgD family transcriptional regulator
VALIDSFLVESAIGGGALLLTGGPGVGKTILLDFAAEAAKAAGTRVLRGVGVEFEADVTYAGLHQILLPLDGEFGLLDPGQRPVLSAALGFGASPAPDRMDVSEAVLALLRRAAARRPLLVIVDDAHWLDRPSVAVLELVAQRLAGSLSGLIAASRPTDGYFGRSRIPEHEVRPLDDEAATDLLRSRFPTLASRDCARLVVESQGNALALLELGSEASAHGTAAPVVAPARSLRTLFASRVRELPAPARHLLLRAALDGTGDPRILRSTGPGHPRYSDLAPAEQAGLIYCDENAGRIVFVHPLFRSVVLKQSTSSELRSAHRALAHLLADQPERRAWHLAEATIEPDARVAVLLADVAGRSMQRGDAVGAVAALLRSAELSPSGRDRGRRLAEAAYLGLDVTGELRSTPQLLAAAHEADPDHNQPLHAAATASYMLLSGAGDVDTAHRLLVGALDAIPVRDAADERVLNEVLGSLLMVCFFGGRADLWDLFHKAVAGAAADVLVSLCGSTFCDPVRVEAAVLEQLDRLIEESDHEVDPNRIVRLATAGVFVDRTSGLREALWRVVRDGRQGGAVASAIDALLLLGFDGFMTGTWEEAEDLLEEGQQFCEAHGYGLMALSGRFVRALLAAGRGDFEAAGVLVDDITRWATPRGIQVAQTYVHRIRTLAALGKSDYEDAYRNAIAISPAGVFAPYAPFSLHVLMDLVEAAVRSDRQAEADAHVTAMREADIAALSPRLAFLAAGAEAIAASGDAATALFEEALAVPGAERWGFELARVRLAYGEHLRRSRGIAASRVQLDAALDAFERMGARPWATRARNELRATGESRSRAGTAGPAALTPREREIAQLAATGLSNKQIGGQLRLSARTVGAHLRHVFQKLGVVSRVVLGDALVPAFPEQANDEGRGRTVRCDPAGKSLAAQGRCGLAGAFAQEYSQGVGAFVADFPGDGLQGHVGGAQQVTGAFDSQILDESDGGGTDGALNGALQGSFADADGFRCVGHAEGLGQMLAGPAFEGCDGGVALRKGARDDVHRL